jgi:NAD dependent epimerase/dehydratase family enzyme
MMPWIHVDDMTALVIAAVDGGSEWAGPINATAPKPVSNKEFSKALGKALHRPAFSPVPSFAIKALYGEMAQIVLTGQNAIPAKATALGFKWSHPTVEEALSDVLAR